MIPKFRAWDKTTSKLHVVNGIYCDNKKIHYIDDNRVRFVGFDNVIIMQSTDMVDRNGNIIFEGDIVKMSKDVYEKNGLEDLKKARKNLDWLIEEMEHE